MPRSRKTSRTWLVRLRIGVALPRALGIYCFIVGPSSTVICSMNRSSMSLSPLNSAAFATADLSSFCTGIAAFLRAKRKMSMAWLALLPRTVSTTTLTLRGEIRRCVTLAFILTTLSLCTDGRSTHRAILNQWFALSCHHANEKCGSAKTPRAYALPYSRLYKLG